jgi:hypothetical protein
MPDEREGRVRPGPLDLLLKPLHSWIWRDPSRRARKLLDFSRTEADSCRHMSRAAELTGDPLLRRLYLRHACDERRHAEAFRSRGSEILGQVGGTADGFSASWLAPGERGFDELPVNGAREDALLAYLHLSEKVAAGRFVVYEQVLAVDPATRALFAGILVDENFHAAYTRKQLFRIDPARGRRRLLQASLLRAWKLYLRGAGAFASLMGNLLLRAQYFIFLWPFALIVPRDAPGWVRSRARPRPESQY